MMEQSIKLPQSVRLAKWLEVAACRFLERAKAEEMAKTKGRLSRQSRSLGWLEYWRDPGETVQTEELPFLSFLRFRATGFGCNRLLVAFSSAQTA
jgi:hypothetical protein